MLLHLVGKGVVGRRLLVGRGRGGRRHRLRVGRQDDLQQDRPAAQYHRRAGRRIRDTFSGVIVGAAALLLNAADDGVGGEVDKLRRGEEGT